MNLFLFSSPCSLRTTTPVFYCEQLFRYFDLGESRNSVLSLSSDPEESYTVVRRYPVKDLNGRLSELDGVTVGIANRVYRIFLN